MTYVGVKCLTRHCSVLLVVCRENHGIYEDLISHLLTSTQLGKTVSAFDSSASWVDVSRCEIESSCKLFVMNVIINSCLQSSSKIRLNFIKLKNRRFIKTCCHLGTF